MSWELRKPGLEAKIATFTEANNTCWAEYDDLVEESEAIDLEIENHDHYISWIDIRIEENRAKIELTFAERCRTH